MRRSLRLLPLMACAAVLSGCGGAASLVGLGSPFEGAWSGTWQGAAENGTVTIAISLLGDLSGNMHSDTSNLDGPLNGAIDDSGDTTVTVTFEGQNPVLGTGTLTLTGSNALGGTINFDGENVAFDMTRD